MLGIRHVTSKEQIISYFIYFFAGLIHSYDGDYIHLNFSWCYYLRKITSLHTHEILGVYTY